MLYSSKITREFAKEITGNRKVLQRKFNKANHFRTKYNHNDNVHSFY